MQSLWYAQPSQNTATGRRLAPEAQGQMTKSGLLGTDTPASPFKAHCGSMR